MARGAKEPLYRKVNTRTHGVHHGRGGEARWERNTKATARADTMRGSMHSGLRHGRDYTPLFRFLQSRVGRPWHEVHSEAVARLDRPDPIFWIVARIEADRKPVVRVGESSYWSGLFVDDEGVLALVAPDQGVETLWPACLCCTHTFNGKPFTNPYRHGVGMMGEGR